MDFNFNFQPVKPEIGIWHKPKSTDQILKNLQSVDIGALLGTGNVSAGQIPPEAQAARDKLDAKVSSTGMSYKDAKATMAEIKEKYKNDASVYSYFESEQPKDLMIYIQPQRALDPAKLPEADRKRYFEALNSCLEIERQNSALLDKAMLMPTRDLKNAQRREGYQPPRFEF